MFTKLTLVLTFLAVALAHIAEDSEEARESSRFRDFSKAGTFSDKNLRTEGRPGRGSGRGPDDEDCPYGHDWEDDEYWYVTHSPLTHSFKHSSSTHSLMLAIALSRIGMTMRKDPHRTSRSHSSPATRTTVLRHRRTFQGHLALGLTPSHRLGRPTTSPCLRCRHVPRRRMCRDCLPSAR